MADLKMLLSGAKQAESQLQNLSQEKIDACLRDFSEKLVAAESEILAANSVDLEKMEKSDPMYDRVELTPVRLSGIAESVKQVADLQSSVGEILEEKKLPNGILLQKISVPFGVVASIYESRPNVTVDVFVLCFKTKNVAVLKCGKEAYATSEAMVRVIHEVLKMHELDESLCVLLPPDRELSLELLQAREFVDVLIPRGGSGLINWVRENARVPIIETGAGVVHVFVDASAKNEMASEIIFNAKTRRPSVCNTVDTVIVHREKLSELGKVLEKVGSAGVEVFADEEAYAVLSGSYDEKLLHHAMEENFGQEFLSLRMAVKVVSSVEEAVSHIAKFGSKHSESVVTENAANAEYFLKNVDAAVVYHNISTAFTDGGEFGMGAEIGISTQKLHARGPMGLRELTTYKWVGRGDGQVRG